jgi:hypothetical protein
MCRSSGSEHERLRYAIDFVVGRIATVMVPVAGGYWVRLYKFWRDSTLR